MSASGSSKLLKFNPKLLLVQANPPGENEADAGTYRSDKELEELAGGGAIGLPVYLEHITEIDGKKVSPSGRVIAAKVGKQTKALYMLLEIYENDNGKLAQKLLEDANVPVSEVSLGGMVIMKEEWDDAIKMYLPKPVARVTTEISLVFKGDRENCKILEYNTADEFLKEYDGDIYKNNKV